MCVCVCVLSFLYHPSHPPVKSGTSPFAYFHTISSLKPVNSSHFAGFKDPHARGNACTEHLKCYCLFVCSFQYVPVVCACLLVQYVDFFSQFDAISPVHFEGEGLGLSLRTGGGDLITGGDSAGEVFQNTPLWEPSIWLTP